MTKTLETTQRVVLTPTKDGGVEASTFGGDVLGGVRKAKRTVSDWAGKTHEEDAGFQVWFEGEREYPGLGRWETSGDALLDLLTTLEFGFEVSPDYPDPYDPS